jgi:formylmethanofuran dehydrogenase subunit D
MGQNSKLKVILVTGRTIEQGVAKEQGKTSQEYLNSVAICFIDPQDLKQLRTTEKSNVLISTEHGSVVVKASKSTRTPHPGVVYVPYGLWANVIVDPGTGSIGMPSLKGIPAEIEPAGDKPLLSLSELLATQFKKE